MDRFFSSGQSATGLQYSAVQISLKFQPVRFHQRRDFDRVMPNTPTAKKRLRQNEKLRVSNKGFRSALRTQVKKVRLAVAAGNLAERSSLSLATVSEHLKVLRKAGLVTVEKDGRYWRYRADAARIAAVLAALENWNGGDDGT